MSELTFDELVNELRKRGYDIDVTGPEVCTVGDKKMGWHIAGCDINGLRRNLVECHNVEQQIEEQRRRIYE